ncbi:uncharacterized protein LOC131045798 [Cryptomeria japonica]|uniref:uncharacterized protein LOC131045798 n=1 Tax=Cryptomeria japonica TaxID=3369 RepID=UPI0027DA1704|nr:uncharacterized protein LOC131045798 [Cryptomeria japonica]XP_057835432.2 uncharacterized protein LOC131045798 [Cryptomeria japonica]XP_057835433.2 uncharacterized protein LOC131045798 [Cryptomeria japonica]XP_057835434.2 uncharacterized protein LOC131045798 [Cryptomeria japonica]XP_057835435.2 uncharacterized protein LOC131045798 [Cryptomeria japonica]XP_057835436.2 uncharacterized protein LOC131045798 [Cryptomeria japonica]XP_057835437.2 uncharacterized protein LOC131045798 [Cryptomeria 
MLAIWRANVDCQLVCSKKAVLQYISKYASKTKHKSESYTDMLKRIVGSTNSDDTILLVIQRLLMGIVADRDISAQETCHMLLKLPLISCTRQFVMLNVGKRFFQCIANCDEGSQTSISYISNYMKRPSELANLTLLCSAQLYTYFDPCKSCKWMKRKLLAIVNVYPQHKSLPLEDDSSFQSFCWSEFLLYKPFRSIPLHIGNSTEEIIIDWKHLQSTDYIRWHVNGIEEHIIIENSEELQPEDIQQSTHEDLYELEFLSQMGASNNFDVATLQMLGRRDFDLNFNWTDSIPDEALHSKASQFILTEKSQAPHTLANPHLNASTNYELARNQIIALDIIKTHAEHNLSSPPLRLVIQGTIGTGKSFVIDYIRRQLNSNLEHAQYPLLVLAPTGISAYNVQATTIHATLCIPIQEYKPLKGHSLLMFQEQRKHLRYILIDEMSFVGPQLLLKIDKRLRETFPSRQHESFVAISVILVSDLAQLPPIMDRPLYASHSTTLALWHTFNTVVTLDIPFHQQGTSSS